MKINKCLLYHLETYKVVCDCSKTVSAEYVKDTYIES